MEDGIPGSVVEEGGVEGDCRSPENGAPLKVESNGDLTHEEELAEGSPDADGIGEDGARGLSPGSVGPSQIVSQMNGNSIRGNEVAQSDEFLPDETPVLATVPGDGTPSTPATTSPTPATSNKGHGLRKWRRIRRDFSRDGGSIADASRILKRGLSITEPPKVKDETKQKNQYEGESSVASVESTNIQSPPSSTAAARTLGTELELLGEVGNFSVGIDSETSDDRSSRFSTAASGPRSKHEGLGHGKDKNRVRNLGWKGSGHAVQPRGLRGKGSAADVTKKFREDQFSFEKENSHSSIESDLRSSAAVIAQLGSTSSNGRQSEASLNYDGENCVEAQVSEEVVEVSYKGTGGDIEDNPGKGSHAHAPLEDKTESNETYPSNQGEDPFVEPIVFLQAAQEALEKEIGKLREISVEQFSLSGDSVQFSCEDIEGSGSVPTKLKLVNLSRRVEHLENELREATTDLKAKGMRVIELEANLLGNKLPDDATTTQSMVNELESELECLFIKKIEAEIEYLLISNASSVNRSMMLGYPFHFAEKRENLSEAYEAKVELLNRKMEKLDVSYQELVGTEEILKLQNDVCNFSMCCFLQVMLLLLGFALFLMQSSPASDGFVPT